MLVKKYSVLHLVELSDFQTASESIYLYHPLYSYHYFPPFSFKAATPASPKSQGKDLSSSGVSTHCWAFNRNVLGRTEPCPRKAAWLLCPQATQGLTGVNLPGLLLFLRPMGSASGKGTVSGRIHFAIQLTPQGGPHVNSHSYTTEKSTVPNSDANTHCRSGRTWWGANHRQVCLQVFKWIILPT